jgi:translation elongation factor EF-G
MLNKVDRLFIDKQYTAEEVHDCMQRVVDDINSFIATHQLKHFPDQRVSFLDVSRSACQLFGRIRMFRKWLLWMGLLH